MFKWMNILGLKEVPVKSAQLSIRHFLPQDIIFDGKMALLDGAKPLAKVNKRKQALKKLGIVTYMHMHRPILTKPLTKTKKYMPAYFYK